MKFRPMTAERYDELNNTRLPVTNEEYRESLRRERISFGSLTFVASLVDEGAGTYRATQYRPFTIVRDGKITRSGLKNLKQAKVVSNGRFNNFFRLLSDCYHHLVLTDSECVYMIHLIGGCTKLFGGLRVGWQDLTEEAKIIGTMIMAKYHFGNTKIFNWSQLPFCHADGLNLVKGHTQHCQMNIQTELVDYCEMVAARN